MGLPKPKVMQFEVGKYICPNTKSPVPLMSSCPLAFMEWPVVVEKCPDCKQKHVLHCEDLHHQPVFGYE